MQFNPLEISDVLLITPRKFCDARGYFMETFRDGLFEEMTGLDLAFVQDNHSHSIHANTVRGLHYQAPPHAQAKLVRCTAGAIIDVAVDVRPNSSTYGKSVQALLTAENAAQLFIPTGFLHGFATLAPNTQVQYKCSDYYNGDCDGSVAWNDPYLNINWGLEHGFAPEKAVFSDKDKKAPKFTDWKSPF